MYVSSDVRTLRVPLGFNMDAESHVKALLKCGTCGTKRSFQGTKTFPEEIEVAGDLSALVFNRQQHATTGHSHWEWKLYETTLK